MIRSSSFNPLLLLSQPPQIFEVTALKEESRIEIRWVADMEMGRMSVINIPGKSRNLFSFSSESSMNC